MSEKEITDICEKDGYSSEQIEGRIANNQQLVDMIDVQIPLHQLLFPVYESPDNIKELYSQFTAKSV